MSHTSAKRWPFIEQEVGNISAEIVDVLTRGEERFQQFEEIFAFAGSTDQGMADLLYKDINIRDGIMGPTDPIAGTATTDQVAIVTDAKGAMKAIHDLFDAANNKTTQPEDRMTAFRRMI